MDCKKLLAAIAILSTGVVANPVMAETHVANDKNGVPGMKVTLNDARIRRSGEEIIFYPVFQQTGSKNVGQLSIDNNRYAWIDDGEPIYTYMPRVLVDVPSDGEPMAGYVEMKDVPMNARVFTRLKIVGRAPNSPKSSPDNYYGDFDYVFTNIPVPQFHSVAPDAATGRPGGMFTDSEIQLGIISAEKSGGDLYVTFTFTNVGKSDKNVEPKAGYAATSEGDRLSTHVRIPTALGAGETVKGILSVKGGADVDIMSVKHDFHVAEKGFSWTPQLILK